MTDPYGQRPGQPGGQPSGGYPQQGGYPQAPGYPQTPGQGQPVQGYPQSPPYGQPAQGYPPSPPQGYPQAPAYGAMPAAPAEYSAGPMRRPGVATAAAVLAFVQAGITAIPGISALVGAFGGSAGASGTGLFSHTVGIVVAIATVLGVALLITGGVQLMGGSTRAMMIAGTAIELAICLYWIIAALSIESDAIGASDIEVDFVNASKGVLIGFAIFFAIMPTISLILSLGQTTTQFLQSRRGH
jgi:hypothetical protein